MYKPINLLIVEDDETMAKVLERLAKENNWTYRIARNGNEAIEALNQDIIEAALIDINLPIMNGMQVLEHMKNSQFATEVIIVTGVGTVETAVSAIKMGAYDFVTKPFDDIRKISSLVEKARERYQMVQKIKQLERGKKDQYEFHGLIGKSQKMQEVYRLMEAIAPTTSTVLIHGESGTGKELVAMAIHKISSRKQKPMVTINCAAIPETLMESELFGHKKGSFTGAIQDKKGLFEEANGGTIFLDEIGEVPLPIQVKLLRVLQEREIRPVGANQSRKVDVRLICATHKNLAEMIQEGTFREDLYYRVNVIGVTIPPLRDRTEDISLLAFHFLAKHSKRMNKKIGKISIDALQAFRKYNWVGNVRELENMVERACVLVQGDTITARNLPPNILGESFYVKKEGVGGDWSQLTYQEAKDKALVSFNKDYITSLLRQTEGNLTNASEKAGMDRSNFKKIVKRYNIDVTEFKQMSKVS